MRDLNFRELFLAAIVLCSCVTWASSRHHYYRHNSAQRSRHRRQGAKLYLPSSFVIPGGKGYGAWGEWSDPTPCSRTCGGGVSSQERICLELDSAGRPKCSGGSKKYFSCNTQDCPDGSRDFRSEQCSEYDSTEFRGVSYTWIPYTKGPNPCELNCMPKGERFYYRYKTKVIDGTPCNSEDLDVCVDGVCQSVGCDLMLGSDAREDKCRECRGNGTRCQTIEGVNDDQSFLPGYNDILLIPAGATSILIQEVRPSNNYLAIRALTGKKYYLNGDYRIDFPRALSFAGATWQYERHSQGVPAPDIIRCLGPTQESVYLSLLLLDKNVGVRYEYSIPNNLVPPPDEQYTWSFTDFTPCSASCGGGFQTRNVSCKSRNDLNEVDEHLCEHYQRPVEKQSCATNPCSANWVEGSWGPCSKPCGEGGTQSRQITCQKIIANGLPSVVSDDECIGAVGEKPALHRKCNEGGKCPQWFTGPWLPCDKLCGQGKQRRNVTCFDKIDGKIEALGDDQCAEKKPDSEKSCMLHPCEGVDWVLSDWSGCESCLSKERTRTAQCATENREIIDASFCSYHPKPVLQEPCHKTKLPACDVQWYASQWSNCSTKCGEGTQSRRVFCGLFDGESILKVDESRCESADKYNDSRPCTVDDEDCKADWHAGPWSECSKKCGGGVQERKVMCLQGNKTSSVEKCGDKSIPDSSQSCNTGPCDADETIGMKGSTQPMFEHEKEGEDEIEEETEDCEGGEEDYEDENEELDLEKETEETSGTTSGSTESSTTEGSTTLGTTESETTGSDGTSITDEGLIMTGSTGSDATGSTVTDMLDEGSGDGSSSDGTMDATASTALDTSTTESSTTDSSTTDSSTTDSSTTDSSTTDSSPTDSSTTDSSTTDSSTTDSSTTDSSTTDSSTTDSSTTDSSTTDSSTTDISTTDSSTTDSSTTDLSTTESSTTPEASSTETETGSTGTGSTETEVTSTEQTGTTETATTGTETTGTTETAVTGTETTGTTETETTGSDATESTETGSTATEGSTSSETSSTEMSSSEEDTSTWSWSSTIESFTDKPRKCRLRKPKSNCAKTEFGCCFDNITAAKGPFDQGCPRPTTCKESKYKCCPDGVSPALGKDNYGCVPIPCNETLFGCCKSDKISAAEGNNQEGCPPPPPACKKSKYKCCKDGVTPAKGPKRKGCPENKLPDIDTRFSPEDCSDSEFGCCFDNVTAATDKGCPCNATQYGCCPDKVSAAQGSNGAGCQVTCEQTRFGCCQDNKTAAHGYLFEGCCINTPHGCCPDNIVPAQGPDGYGCNCRDSPNGCCPDHITPANGPENEGCGCEYTKNGCCPDKHTPAQGPDFEGCDCHTYQFGCCLDGVTKAKGPQNLGCRCQETEFGCCSDEVTAAIGPNREGCDCSASKYGCCPDGYTEAQGEKFLGCTDVPENVQESCGLEKDLGPCRNYTVRWFFDMSYGGCSRFWYGGCEGNNNRFMSQDECQDACVAPKDKDVCKLPKVKGPCNSYIPKWYYDASREQCGQFVYGGCLGNNNNFETREDCQSLCEKPKDKDACQLSTETGPCRGNFVRWGYSNEEKRCNQFIWGGCEGNDNRFDSESACMHACHAPGTLQDECMLPREVGNCTEKIPKWNFDATKNRCLPFYYTGCGGNDNAFDSESECQESCPERYVQELCTLPATVGECANYQERWYFNTADRRCRQFYYGGCGGNGNNFATESECENRCSAPAAVTQATPPPFTTDACFLRSDRGPCTNSEPRWWYDSRFGGCSQFMYGGCGGNANNFPSREHCEYYCGQAQDVCQLPMRVGSCDGSYGQYYYEASTDSCSQFAYSGCEGNGNRFNTREECESRCIRQLGHQTSSAPTTPIYVNERYPEPEDDRPECEIPSSLEPCGAVVPAWYYNPDTAACTQYYGGACTHTNRYNSEEECERSCGIFRNVEVCRYNLDAGPCNAPTPKYYFDINKSTCLRFNYSGCEGGPNRFSTLQECESVCQPRNQQPVTTPREEDNNEINVDESYAKPDICAPYRDYCSRLSCEYGVMEQLDSYGCPQCRCAQPCASVTCEPNETCEIQAYTETDGSRRHVGVCRTVSSDNGTPSAPFVEEEKTEPEIVSSEGGIAVLRCVVTGNPPPTITWERGAITIDGTSGRYKILTDGALQIVSLYRNDSGIYVCIADNGIGEPIRKDINLVVSDPVQIEAGIGGESDSVVVGTIGTPLPLRCAAYGYPSPDVNWYRGNSMVPFLSQMYERITQTELLIRSLSYEALGEYVCEVYNGYGKPESWVVTVKAARPSNEDRDSLYWLDSVGRETTTEATTTTRRVVTTQQYFRVPVRTQINAESSQFNVGSDLTLPCEVDGYPVPEVNWLKDGIPFNNTERVHISDAHRLSIVGVTSEDSGTYTCYARNDFSDHRTSLQVIVQGVYVRSDCTDNPYFANCALIVSARYCNNLYYASFCCRSCTLAGQLNNQKK